MHPSSSRLEVLYRLYLNNSCSAEERKEFMALIAEQDAEKVYSLIEASWEEEDILFPMKEERAEQLFASIQGAALVATQAEEQEVPVDISRKTPLVRSKRWWVAAAAALLIMSAGIWYTSLLPDREKVAASEQKPEATSSALSRNGAMLTLADGTIVMLDSTRNGMIAEQDGARVELKDNALLYSGAPGNGTAFNTMSTPKGKQFRLRLPDGTQVMLNANSRISYPVSFSEKERMVSIQGEAWFDVKQDPNRPFRVELPGKATIEVLGTGFNVRAYPEERAAKTTLVSGSIRLNAGTEQVLMRPAQQVSIYKNGELKLNANADTSQVLAWKNGEFSFQNLTLQEAMYEIACWYDVETVFTGDVPKLEFYGSMGRNLTLEQVVRLLKSMGLKISLQQKQLIIAP